MDLETFLSERRHHWKRLESLLGQVESKPEWELGAKGLQELVHLYRQTSSDLNRLRTLTADAALLSYLNQLVGRGYRFIYRGSVRRVRWSQLWDLFVVQVPAAFRKERRYVLGAAFAMLAGMIFGFSAVVADPSARREIVPQAFFSENPRTRVEHIEKEDERITNLEEAAEFGAYLYTHNIQVSFLVFAAGALTLAGALFLLFYNGVILGAIAAAYVLEGVHLFFWAWVGPHGSLELPAIVFAGAAGLRAGVAFWMPGNLSRGMSLRESFPSVWRILLGSAAALVLAGIVEGSFSQFSAKTIPYGFKIAMAALLFVLLMVYLFFRRLGEPSDGAKESGT